MATLKGSPSSSVSRRVPPAKRLLRAHAERRQHEEHPRSRIVDQRKQPIAALEAKRRPAFEEKRHVGAQLRGGRPEPRFVDPPETPERAQRGGGVAASPAKPRLPRDSLHEIDGDVARAPPAAGPRESSTCRTARSIERWSAARGSRRRADPARAATD